MTIHLKSKLDGYQYAVTTVDRAEGNAEIGTQWQDTHCVPLDMTLREAIRAMFADWTEWPKGRVCLTVPEILPFDPDKQHKVQP